MRGFGQIERGFTRLQNTRDFTRERDACFLNAVLFAETLLRQSARDPRRRRRAHVGRDKRVFQFSQIGRVELLLGENRGETFRELARRLTQAIEQALGLFFRLGAFGLLLFLVEQTPNHAATPIRCAPSWALKRRR